MPVLLGGVLPLEDGPPGRWGPAPDWRWPVGDPAALGRSANSAIPPFQVNRGVEVAHGRARHQGLDIANGRAGDTVSAAAAGLVVVSLDGDNGNGYGGHVVIAHHADGGGLVYSVYAHLQAGTIAVRAGDIVSAGDPLARVGQTGRASTPHLHFEIRRASEPQARWERAAVVDPVEFLSAYATPARAGPEDPYLSWGIAEGLLERGVAPGAALERSAWWRMLAAALENGPDPRANPLLLRDSLIERGMLPEEEDGAPGSEHLDWSECARDVRRLRQLGVRMAHGPLEAREHGDRCEAEFGTRAPSAHVGGLRRLSGEPGAREACMLIADVSGPRPPAELRPSRHAPAHPSHPASAHLTHRRRSARRRAGAAHRAAAGP